MFGASLGSLPGRKSANFCVCLFFSVVLLIGEQDVSQLVFESLAKSMNVSPFDAWKKPSSSGREPHVQPSADRGRFSPCGDARSCGAVQRQQSD